MNKKLYKLMNWPEIEEIIYSDGDNPNRILGAHKVGSNFLIQAFVPYAKKMSVVTEGTGSKKYEMELADDEGFFATLIPYKENIKYYYEIITKKDEVIKMHDPYAFEPMLDREDVIKLSSGIYYDIYKKMGAHVMERNGIIGTHFSVWAPDAERVSVIGDFNSWDGRVCQMYRLDPAGIYEIFIPDVSDGAKYQYEIKTKTGLIYKRPDPFGTKTTDSSGKVSVVHAIKDFKWTDSSWIKNKRKIDVDGSPLSVCEISLDDFAKKYNEGVTYDQLCKDIIETVKDYGFNCVEFLPITEHKDGHPFHITSYFSVKSAYGDAEDFMKVVDKLHSEGIRVILDFVPTFFPFSEEGLQSFDGKPLYEYEDPRLGFSKKTGDLIFDYGRKEVTNYLISNAVFLTETFHADGIRLTDISKILYLDYDRNPGEWVPNIYGGNENLEALEFIKQLVATIKEISPDILMITKETACWPKVTESLEDGGLGFDFKWNNGFTKDFKEYMSNDPLFRAGHHDELTFTIFYSFTERYILEFNHENLARGIEGLYTIMPGDSSQKLANTRLAISYMISYPGKKMLYIDPNAFEIDTAVYLENVIRDLNELYYKHPALYDLDVSDKGFEWINSIAAEECIVSFVRKSKDCKDMLLIVANFAGNEKKMRIGLPEDGRYSEIFNSDDQSYGGTGIRNGVKIAAERKECDGRAYSIE
ncbi:MAG: 1,4-alpha-glucan branching enzyme, partial [Butyrivibrio sp.]|nr:1,4-alpha-glucan branching enzyme [Butyrivibrio sp.]